MRVAVTSAVFNEEKNITRFLEALLAQTRRPDEIILVDDGSRDRTAAVIADFSARHPFIRCISQENKGPASARNRAWKNASSDICIFTDGDCVPEPDWIEKLLPPFEDPGVGAAAGTYKTLNPGNILARFIGLEIAWRYRNIQGDINAHGSYNLAVRRSLLEEVGGFKEDYPFPSGEDWDLTYKISDRSKIRYVPEAIVGHYHPEDLLWYLKNQMRRGYDRIRVYRDHPEKKRSDTYTGSLVKYQVAAAALWLPAVLLSDVFLFTAWVPDALLFFLFVTTLIPFPYFMEHDTAAAFASIPIQMIRFFAWAWGAFAGYIGQESLIPGSRRKS